MNLTEMNKSQLKTEDAEIYARKFKCVLIKCDGCGAEMHRDYPALPNACMSEPRTKDL